MIRRSAIRLFAALLAAVGGLSVPATALAHGVAHGREARSHAAEQLAVHAADAAHAHTAADLHDAGERGHHAIPVHEIADHDLVSGVSASHDDEGDHGHPQVGRAAWASGRLDLSGLAVAALPVAMLGVDVVLVASAARLLLDAPPRAGPAQLSPQPSRAPPTG